MKNRLNMLLNYSWSKFGWCQHALLALNNKISGKSYLYEADWKFLVNAVNGNSWF